jgi:heme exporter protein B
MRSLFLALFLRDLKLAARRRSDALLPLAFFALACALFPLGVGPLPQTLHDIAPGVIWACALLAALVPLPSLYALDHADGSLDQMLLAGNRAALGIAAAKAAAHWTTHGLPLALLAPGAGLMLGMTGVEAGVLCASLLIGTPCLSLLGAAGAALTVGLRNAGVLVVVLVLPLCVPVLVFGAGAAVAVQEGQSPLAHLALLGAMLLFTATATPPLSAAALRASLA